MASDPDPRPRTPAAASEPHEEEEETVVQAPAIDAGAPIAQPAIATNDQVVPAETVVEPRRPRLPREPRPVAPPPPQEPVPPPPPDPHPQVEVGTNDAPIIGN